MNFVFPLRGISLASGIALLLWAPPALRADVTPAALFQDHAVLQAGKPVPVWGQAAPAERVSVTFAGQSASTTAGVDGNWRVTLPPLKVNAQPATLTVAGKNTVVINDVLVGEVWLCSGQSNMEFTLKAAANAEAEIAAANFPAIRHLRVRNQVTNDPAPKFAGNWATCTPANAGSFTAVGYFFARELHQKLGGVPVGIIHSSWGGTDIEAWMDAESIARNPNAKLIADRWQKMLADAPTAQVKYDALVAEDNRKAEEAKARNDPTKTLAQRSPQPRWLAPQGQARQPVQRHDPPPRARRPRRGGLVSGGEQRQPPQRIPPALPGPHHRLAQGLRTTQPAVLLGAIAQLPRKPQRQRLGHHPRGADRRARAPGDRPGHHH